MLTGGLGLLGLNYVLELSQRGAKVAVLDMKVKKDAEKILKQKTGGYFRTIFYRQTDITDENDVKKAAEEIIKNFGGVDVLINNAALVPKVEKGGKTKSSGSLFEELGIDSWNEEIKVNILGTVICCKVFGKKMRSGSSVINISSIYGVVAPDQSIYRKGFVKPGTYGVTKAAVINLTKYLAAYWGHKNIRVNCVVLGGVFAGQDRDFLKKYSAKTPLGRMADSRDFNGIMVYLSSDASSYATGASFVIDGGWTAW